MKQTFTFSMARLRLGLLIACLLTFTQCAEQLSMKHGSQVNELGVCLYFAPGVPDEFQEQFEASLDTYIANFNATPHAFKLTECKNSSALQIRIEDVKYTTQEQRAAGIVLSTLGLVGLPVTLITAGAPIVAWFYYIPKNTTLATTAFTADIAHPTLGSLPKSYITGGIFGNDAKQRERHAKKFQTHLNMLFTEVEKSYTRTSAKKATVTASNQQISTENN